MTEFELLQHQVAELEQKLEVNERKLKIRDQQFVSLLTRFMKFLKFIRYAHTTDMPEEGEVDDHVFQLLKEDKTRFADIVQAQGQRMRMMENESLRQNEAIVEAGKDYLK